MLVSKEYLKSLHLLIILVLLSKITFSQEEITIADMSGCTQFYWHAPDVIKQIKRTHDTMTYIHDGELVVFYNKRKTRKLTDNTFYIFNHGFNKLLTMTILSIELEASNNKKDKKVFITSPEKFMTVYYKDTLPRCTHMIVGPLQVQVPGYNKVDIKGIFVAIKYYDTYLYKWFLDDAEIPKNSIDIYWKKQ